MLYSTYLKSVSLCFQSTDNTVTANADDSYSDATSVFILVRNYLASQQISTKEKCPATSGNYSWLSAVENTRYAGCIPREDGLLKQKSARNRSDSVAKWQYNSRVLHPNVPFSVYIFLHRAAAHMGYTPPRFWGFLTTHRHIHPVGRLWTSHQPAAQTGTCYVRLVLY